MPKQRGPLSIKGTVDEISFYEDKIHGHLSRRKGGPTKKQIKTSDSMEIVRQNDSEFGKGAKSGALVRRAFRMLIFHCREYSMSRRLHSLIISLMRMDGTRARGQRGLLKDHLTRLQEFELNDHISYRKFFKKNVDIEINNERVVAKGTCTLPKGIGKKANLYKVVSVLASVDFEKDDYLYDAKETDSLPCAGSKSFVFQHHLNMENCVFYGLVICFYKKKGQNVELIKEDKLKAGFISFVD